MVYQYRHIVRDFHRQLDGAVKKGKRESKGNARSACLFFNHGDGMKMEGRVLE